MCLCSSQIHLVITRIALSLLSRSRRHLRRLLRLRPVPQRSPQPFPCRNRHPQRQRPDDPPDGVAGQRVSVGERGLPIPPPCLGRSVWYGGRSSPRRSTRRRRRCKPQQPINVRRFEEEERTAPEEQCHRQGQVHSQDDSQVLPAHRQHHQEAPRGEEEGRQQGRGAALASPPPAPPAAAFALLWGRTSPFPVVPRCRRSKSQPARLSSKSSGKNDRTQGRW